MHVVCGMVNVEAVCLLCDGEGGGSMFYEGGDWEVRVETGK